MNGLERAAVALERWAAAQERIAAAFEQRLAMDLAGFELAMADRQRWEDERNARMAAEEIPDPRARFQAEMEELAVKVMRKMAGEDFGAG